MSGRSRVRVGDERGASLLVVSVGIVAFLMVAGLVVDLSALRYDRRADALAADAAAMAGVEELDPFRGSDGEGACLDAWDYLLLNILDEPAPTVVPNCAGFAGICDPGVARLATGIAGPYSIEIVHPVTDGHPMMAGQPANAAADGAPCQRLGVRIVRARDFAFASVMGFDSSSTDVKAVARIGVGLGQGELVPLVLIEPISCDALYTSGQGKVTVTYFEDTPGIIVVDSNASKSSNPNRCGNNTWSLDSKGTQNGWIRAIPVPDQPIRSAILTYALSGTQGADPTSAYDPSDLTAPVDPADISDPTEPVESYFRLYPEPRPTTRRITRAPIDWRYNCKASYPGYPLDVNDASAGTIPIVGCPKAGTVAPHIDNLRALYGGAAQIGSSPGGFMQWSAFYDCDLQPDDPAIVAAPGDWWIDCPGGLSIRNTVTFSGGSIVADGGIRVFGTLDVNFGTTNGDELVYLRSGTFQKSSDGNLSLDRVFVYLDDGNVDFGGGAGALDWIAPIGGVFEDLALWSESTLDHEIGGQAGNTLEGTLFTPLALFVLTGQGGQFQTAAQFLTRRLEVKGQGEVRMEPDPDRITLVPVREIWLIR